MRLLTLLMVTISLHLTLSGNSQTVSIAMKNAPVPKVLKEIIRKTGTSIIYKDTYFKNLKPVSIDVKNATLTEVLDQCLSGLPFEYSREGNSIIIKPKKKETKPDSSLETEVRLVNITGTVFGLDNQPLVGATISVKDAINIVTSDEKGNFNLAAGTGSTLVVSYVGYHKKELKINEQGHIRIALLPMNNSMDTAKVVFNTGYQQVPLERATGSFTFVSKKMLDSRVATNIIDKLDGITNGMVFNKTWNGKTQIRIRGESTIYANAEPLIVVDNFPFDGDIRSINPNDVENITILKDAAAASIWGVQAGNGVIVITTKRGKINQPMQVVVTSNISVSEKPDLFFKPRLRPADFIGLEKYLFEKDAYSEKLTDASMPALSPVVELLYKKQNGMLSEEELQQELEKLKRRDVRFDLSKYLYQKVINQQYQVSVSSGGLRSGHYFSAGVDRNRLNLIGNAEQRITLNSQHIFKPVKFLELGIRVTYAEALDKNQGIDIDDRLYPYMRLVDETGKELSVPRRRAEFEDTISRRGFGDWKLYPLQSRNDIENTAKRNDVLVVPELKISLPFGIDLRASYQYQSSGNKQRKLYREESYFIRNRLNGFAILDNKGNYVESRFPKGGQLELMSNSKISHSGRLDAHINRNWGDHLLDAIIGFEARQIKEQGNASILYGFDINSGTFVVPNSTTYYPTYPSGASMLVSLNDKYGLKYTESADRFRSFYSNFSYTWLNKYIISGNARFDGSNYFGVETNRKTVPLWGGGIRWDIGKEGFLNNRNIGIQSIRFTYGYNGNLDKSSSALTTIEYYSSNDPNTGLPLAVIRNLPNRNLRWERLANMNIAIDFSVLANKINGSLEYFQKQGSDLIGEAQLDPTSGVQHMKGNFSGLRTRGIDFGINTVNLQSGSVQWRTSFAFNFSSEIVTRYDPPVSITFYKTIVPIVGKPLYNFNSYKWAGLDPANGDPMIYLGDTLTKLSNFSSAELKQSDFKYWGRYNPPITGFLMNIITWKNLTAIISLDYKFKYYFRRPSVNYSTLWLGDWLESHEDYNYRWQKPGDEQFTQVPSISYAHRTNSNRDAWYSQSEILVEKGDHIRLTFVDLKYAVHHRQLKKLGIQQMQIGLNVKNFGVLWKANRKGLDPENYANEYPAPRNYTFTANINF